MSSGRPSRLETDHQRERWNAAFDKWIESAGHS
jgi:hypothetical protein